MPPNKKIPEDGFSALHPFIILEASSAANYSLRYLNIKRDPGPGLGYGDLNLLQ